MSQTPRPQKLCLTCGRHFAYRKVWARVWDQVKYCSHACRARKVEAIDTALEQAILATLGARGAGKTMCPSEASRAVYGDRDGLRPANMQRCRAAARRLCAQSRLEITQRGQVVDPDRARGPIRLRLREP